VVTQPSLIVFDVNETLSDMAPLQRRFEEAGLVGHDAMTWFASLLRDGFALTVTGINPSFAAIARESLKTSMSGRVVDSAIEEAISHVMDGIGALGVHGDVVEGVTALHEQGRRLVTLSNGATNVAAALFDDAGIAALFETLISVEDAPRWKPAREAYEYALAACEISDPDEAMLVAAHPWDIDGAHRAGLRTAWINRSDGPYPTYFSRPDLEASSVLDLARQLAL
jgi:2-haloacid dehalogenase